MKDETVQLVPETQETSAEIKAHRKADRERQVKHRAKKALGVSSFQDIAENWDKNANALGAETRAQLLARHQEIGDLETEVDEICDGVARGLRAETLTALNANKANEIFPRPDICFEDCKADVIQHPSINYGSVEAMAALRTRPQENWELTERTLPLFRRPFTKDEQAYVDFGFHAALGQDTLQNVREALAIYWLRTKDTTLDGAIVQEAINDVRHSRWSPHNECELRKLLDAVASA